MKVLHTVEFYHPSVGGMQEVVKQLSERIVKLGHDVTVATTRLPERNDLVINGVKIEEFDIKGNLVRGMTGEVERYREFLIDSDFDVIVNFAAQQWATDGMITILEKIKAKKVFVPTGFSGLYSPLYKGYFESMKTWMKQYDMNVFLSDNYRDINFARDNGVINTVLIPNGAGEDEFLMEDLFDIREKLGIPKSHFLILHVGSHTGVKGHREAIEIFTRARIKNATFLLVGNELVGGCAESCRGDEKLLNQSRRFKADGKRVVVASLSREETVAAYKAADLFLFPSNIECSPIVLFECMASKTPFLTTDIGNAVEIVDWSQGGIVLPTIDKTAVKHPLYWLKAVVKYVLAKTHFYEVPVVEDFVASQADIDGSVKILEKIYNSEDQRRRMAEAGFKAWQERFTWEKIAQQYEQMYSSMVRGG